MLPNRKSLSLVPGLLILALGFTGCEGTRSDIRVTPEPAGANCLYGGVKVETGHDENDNGVLDDEEVADHEYMCNQRVDGRSMAFDIRVEGPGPNCDSGGIKVMVGIDDNDNTILEPAEVDSTNYVCHGRTRLVNIVPVGTGTECEQGGVRVESGYDLDADGSLEAEEVDSSVNVCNGRASLIKVTPVEEGGACPAGGIRVQTGFDVNGNSSLDAAEVQGVELVCNGEDGYNALVRQSDIAPDPTGACYYGGVRFESGLDSNRNGTLDSSEVETTEDVCTVQVNERMTLVKNSAELPGTTCTYGGIKTEVGIDDNNDHILDAGEVDSTTYQCNQLLVVDGLTSLVDMVPATATQCQFGGYVMKTGLDDDRDGTLDSVEVDETSLICNGANGYNGVTRTESYSGSQCGPNGGFRLMSGLDMDRDGYLDTAEVQATSYICHGDDGLNGFDGLNALVEVFDAGSACGIYGGVLIETGLDINDNGFLDLSEVESSAYVCNGLDGLNSLIKISSDGGNCGPYGGSLIEVGLDLDADNVLDLSEVESYTYVCNGYDGADSLIEAVVNTYSACGGAEGMRVTVGIDYDADGYIDSGEVVNQFYICENWETYYP